MIHSLQGEIWTPSKMIKLLGERIENEESVYYWCSKNNIPVFCPAITDGSIGDAAGYAMRGGRIYVRGDAGYRAGIHMKAYQNKIPLLIIGGCAGSFLGEYQAGGIIVVLGLERKGRRIVGNFPCTGMHGGQGV